MNIKNVTIGADVEVFLKNKTTGEIVSAEGHIKGTKEQPFIFDQTNKYFATSLDNVLAEFCIPPATNKAEFYNYLRKSLGYINNNIPKELCTAIVPAHSLDFKWLQTEQAMIFGCEPDFNAYTGRINEKPFCEDFCLRSAGGHIHVGYENPSKKISREIIKAFDLHIGVPSVIMEPDNKRKELYGKAGAFRYKDYGVEYRTISNYYLAAKKHIFWIYDSAIRAIQWLNEGNTIDATLGEFVENTINSNDKISAKELIKNFNLQIV